MTARFRRSAAAIAVVLGLAGIADLSVVSAAPALAVGTYNNADIATDALNYVNHDYGQECWGFVRDMIYKASGGTQDISAQSGDYFQHLTAAGGKQITSISNLSEGDVVQIGRYGSDPNLHTFIIVSHVSGSTFEIVDSNHMLDDVVHEYNRTVSFGSDEEAFRFGTVSTAPPSYADGTFIKGDSSNTVYIMAGGSPMAMTTWSYWGGSHPVTTIPQATMNALLSSHPYPADGTFIKKGGTNAVLEVIGSSYMDVSSWSSWGGAQHVTTVDPWAIQHQLLRTPRDGTFVKVGTSKAIMEIVGDSALDVSSWNPFGGSQHVTTVDPWAVQHDLLKYPADSTFIKAGGTNSILEMVGGSALPVSSWANVGGGHTTTVVDPWAILHDLRQYPLDGTYVKNAVGNGVYIIAGGAALGVSSWSAVGGAHSVVDVDQWAITNYLRSYPLDGTLIKGYGSGREYLIQNQAAVYQSTPTGSPTIVDDWAIQNQLGVSNG